MTTMQKVFEDMFAAKEAADDLLRERDTAKHAIIIGDYALYDIDATRFGLSNIVTGEAGVFDKADFEAHVSAFFGMNF